MKSPKKKELAQVLAFIADSYAGDYASISRDLNKAIYCLHFLAKDEIPRNEVQDLCFALHKLGECFHQVHSKQRTRRHQKFDQAFRRTDTPRKLSTMMNEINRYFVWKINASCKRLH